MYQLLDLLFRENREFSELKYTYVWMHERFGVPVLERLIREREDGHLAPCTHRDLTSKYGGVVRIVQTQTGSLSL